MAELTKQSVTTVILSNNAITPDVTDVKEKDPAKLRDIRAAMAKEALRPYTMLAIGFGRDAEGPFNVVVLQHASPALAQENLAKLKSKIDTGQSVITQRKWNDSISKYDASVNGVFLTAKVRSRFPTLLYDAVLNEDTLLMHE